MLLITEKYKEQIAEIRDLYNTAEQDLKAVGRETNKLIVAGVNQCRYAGQHLVRALHAQEDKEIIDELAAAKRHLIRAVYDANDAAVQHYLISIDRFRSVFSVNLKEVIPDYGEVLRAVTDARKHIDRASELNHSNREQLYREIRKDIKALRDAYQTLLASQPDCAAALKKERRFLLKSWALIVIGSISASALVVGLII